ncbi:hypothetical protein [Laribacter hongkongensis]|uniref:hypothetical protein n=1 Tax=Laribacter hongkongensis TaxID=168471 RepID=UPI001EFC3555|nr:hypothetical protein [Laribacter hongkongensis]MCG9031188.1 hypothetical protein [Laribacter hongkongensis]MCG9092509.1 hypothetical protein [Laribacter hongkongensis]
MMSVSDYFFRIDFAVLEGDAGKQELENIWSEVQELFLHDSQCYLSLDEVLRIYDYFTLVGHQVLASERIKTVDFIYTDLLGRITK